MTSAPEAAAGDVSASAPFDPLTAEGAAELRRRIADATPRAIPREELDGHVSLSPSEVWELGVAVAPAGVRGARAAILGRLLVLVGAALATAMLAVALRPVLEPVLGAISDRLRDPGDEGVEAGTGLAAACLVLAAAAYAAVPRGVRLVRRGVAARRRAAVAAGVPAQDDPGARAAVAVVPEPGALRVSLLWLRADPEDPALLEVRTLAEERVPGDAAIGAEDAVVALSAVALRADAARALATGRAAAPPAVAVAGPPASRSRTSRALVREARRRLPAVDPREPVAPGWDPAPLTDRGRAEMAARLVRARPYLWNAAALERLAVDPARPRADKPAEWPADRIRRQDQPPAFTPGRRVGLLTLAGLAAGTWIVALGSIDTAEDPGSQRVVAWVAFGVAALVVGRLRRGARRRPGRALLESVREAARTPHTRLEGGVPGPAGRLLVLHGRRAGQERLELVHVRPAPDDEPRGRLQVRTLAWRPVDAGEDVHAAVQDWWTVADDAGLVTTRRREDAGGVQRLNAALGRAVARRRAIPLRHEPLAWAAGAAFAFAGLMLLGALLSDDALDEGAALAVTVVVWPLLLGGVLWRAARRVRDPAGDD
ncbi:hypothetical protein [Patulibacter sp. SYSU D01012]|uniref:hypothetical protein n=1 Tax=Patulibacter sp. SYSU D01012 TaxID=2817381 RepID=UPI001B309C39|nr:hypothetical protein [Patulibacter sp. SYSU D01012]